MLTRRHMHTYAFIHVYTHTWHTQVSTQNYPINNYLQKELRNSTESYDRQFTLAKICKYLSIANNKTWNRIQNRRGVLIVFLFEN